MAPEHVAAVLERVVGAEGVFRLMAGLLYGSGLRLMECCQLRVKDVQLARGQIVVRAGKGNKDRVVMLPKSLRTELERILEGRRKLHSATCRGAWRGSTCRTRWNESIRGRSRTGLAVCVCVAPVVVVRALVEQPSSPAGAAATRGVARNKNAAPVAMQRLVRRTRSLAAFGFALGFESLRLCFICHSILRHAQGCIDGCPAVVRSWLIR